MFDNNLDLSACTECYVAAANGTDGMDIEPDRERDILAGLEAWGEMGYVLASGDESDGFGFRWESECAVCHTRLGGDRHLITAIPR